MQVTITGQGVKQMLLRILILVVIAGVGLGIWQIAKPKDPFGGRVEASRWQAVFLSDGRIYFGHLHKNSRDFFELRDAFFVQQVQGSGKNAQTARQVRPISEQLEGPENRALLQRSSVVQIENLRPDSEAVKAIEQVRSSAAGK